MTSERPSEWARTRDARATLLYDGKVMAGRFHALLSCLSPARDHA
jgi:hypothetical protein